MGALLQAAWADGLPDARDRIESDLLKGSPAAQADAKAVALLIRSGPIGDAAIAETRCRTAARRTPPDVLEGVAAFPGERQPAWCEVAP